MSTKRQKITKIVNKYIVYGQSNNIPFFNDKEKIAKFKRDYTTDHIAGLMVKYIIPAYDQGIDTLKGYLNLEMDRVRMMGAMSGMDENIIKFKLSEEQENDTIKYIVEIIDVIRG